MNDFIMIVGGCAFMVGLTAFVGLIIMMFYENAKENWKRNRRDAWMSLAAIALLSGGLLSLWGIIVR